MRLRGEHLCGGSIISTTRGLTAARCVIPKSSPLVYSILAGTANRTAEADGQLRVVLLLERHPSWSRDTDSHDVALILWKTPLVFGSTVRAIALPPQGIPIAVGANATVTGWGDL